METPFTPTRHAALRLPGGLLLGNRVVVPAMASQTGDERGFATPVTEAHYRRLAESGAGLVLVEYTYVHPSGRSEERQLGADDDLKVPGLARLARAIRASGAKAGLQLTHGGAKSSRALGGGQLMGPSPVAVPVKDRSMETPDPMNAGQIRLWIDSFAAAAARARDAGFDLVEIHSAHGYGLNQWLSPLTNQRVDSYGGAFEGRIRLLTEVVAAVRQAAPGLAVSVRIPGQDFMPGGLGPEEGLATALRLEALGVDIVSVSSGIGGWRRPGERSGEGYLLSEARRIQAQLRTPVIGVGGIESAAFIDEIIGRGDVQLTAVGRAILKDPRAWRHAQLEEPASERLEKEA